MDVSRRNPHDEAMNTEMTSTEPAQGKTTSSRELVRPHQRRMIGGVALGLANYLVISPVLVRIAFAVTLFFGGLGLVAYVAGWLLIRDEREPESIAQRVAENVRSGPAWIGVVLILVAVLIVLDRVTYLSGSILWATVLLIGGVLLYRGDLARPRSDRPTPSPAPSNTPTMATPAPLTDVVDGPPSSPPHLPKPPSAAPPPAPAGPPPPRSILGRLTVGVGLLALGALAVADNLTTLVNPQPRHYLALATVAVGTGLLVGAWVGRARWMILLGVLLVPPLLVSPMAEFDWRTNFDARVVSPATVAELQSSYDPSVARLVFDLTDIPWDGDVASFEASIGAGEIVLIVPDDVAVTGSVRVGVGEIQTPSGTRSGFGELSSILSMSGDSGTIAADLSVRAGRIEVVRADSFGRFGVELQRFGDIDAAPTSLDELDDIALRGGDVTLDLTGLDIEEAFDSGRVLHIEVGAGDVKVLVPSGLDVVVNAGTGVGTVSLFGNTVAGLGVWDYSERVFGSDNPVELMIQVGVGDITVIERNS